MSPDRAAPDHAAVRLAEEVLEAFREASPGDRETVEMEYHSSVLEAERGVAELEKAAGGII